MITDSTPTANSTPVSGTASTPFNWRREGAWLLALLAFALVLNVGFGLAVRYRPAPEFLEFDEKEYLALANMLANGDLPILGRRTLGFPLLIAAVRSISHNFLFLQVATTAMFACSIPLLYLLARRLAAPPLVATVAALAFALWPSAAFYGSSLYSETAALPVFLAALIALSPGNRIAPARQGIAIWSCLLAGILLGIATHVRPMYLLFLPFLALLLLAEDTRWRHAVARFALALAGFMMVILPWSVMVSQELRHPVLVTANGGETLSGGLTPRLFANGARTDAIYGRTVWVGPGKWMPIEESGYLSPTELKLPYAAQDGLLRERAMAWVRGHPGQAAVLELSKLSYMWGIWPLARNSPSQLLFGNIPILLLLLVVMVLVARNPRSALPLARLWVLPLFVSAVALISWGSWRFRQPGDLGLIALAVMLAAPYVIGREPFRTWQDRLVRRVSRARAPATTNTRAV